ncbi:hypothetical protein ES703_16705 [subsurface metagenome]
MLLLASVGFIGDIVGIELYFARFCFERFTVLNLLIPAGKGLIIKFITVNEFSLGKLFPGGNIDVPLVVVVYYALVAVSLISFPVFIPILIGGVVLEIFLRVYAEFFS